jgi:choline dehydrogenase-like flavoprotein
MEPKREPLSARASLPKFADTVVIGGGTAGAAIAGLLAEHSDQSVLLIEAGPDYGPFEAGRWPAELTDAGTIPPTHDWGYNSGDQYAPRVIGFERARVIGGCSSHNGCAAIWGSRADYDGWAALNNRDGHPTNCDRCSAPPPSVCAFEFLTRARSLLSSAQHWTQPPRPESRASPT